MKTIFSLAFVLLLAGCGTITNPYDNNEFELWVRMLYNSQELEKQCETAPKLEIYQRLSDIYKDARITQLYAEYTPLNEEVEIVAAIVANDVEEMRDFYRTNEHNVTYCSRKTALLTKKIEAIIEQIPERLRI